MTLPRPHILLPILKEHFGELDTLWERREMCVYDSVWNHQDLAELEERANRHLEGLLIGQGHALDLAREALQGGERGAATAGAVVMLNLGSPELAEELVRTMESTEPEVAHGIRIALRHHELGPTEALLRPLTTSKSPLVRACACDVLAFHRRPPAEDVRPLLTDEDEEVRTLAIASIGRWGGDWQEEDLHLQLTQCDSALVQRAALETSVRVALPDLLSICLEAAYREENPSLEALKFLGVIGDEAEIGQIEQALDDFPVAGAALCALGSLGYTQPIPAIIKALSNPLVAHAAAAAFLRITAAENVQGEPLKPPAEISEEEADFWDEHVEADPLLAEQWWQNNAEQFAKNERYQGGCAVQGWPVETAISLEARRDEFLRACFLAGGSLGELELESAASAINP